MSDTNTVADQSNEPVVDELALLKGRAKMMGIVHSNNIGLEALRQKIAAKMEGLPDAPEVPEASTAQPNPLAELPEVPTNKPGLRQYIHDKQMKLVRLRITNMDPKKKDLPGEIFTVANDILGTVKKFVPYGEATDNGYHVPYCIYRMLEKRRFLNIREGRARNGKPAPTTSSWAKEFALEVLPPLSPAQIRELATAQAAAGVFNED